MIAQSIASACAPQLCVGCDTSPVVANVRGGDGPLVGINNCDGNAIVITQGSANLDAPDGGDDHDLSAAHVGDCEARRCAQRAFRS